MYSVIFTGDEQILKFVIYFARCLNPKCLIKRKVGLKVGQRQISDNAIQVLNYYKARQYEQFLEDMYSIAKILELEKYYQVCTKKNFMMYEGKRIKDLQIINLQNSRIDYVEGEKVAIDSSNSEFVKNIPLSALMLIRKEYPQLNEQFKEKK